MKENLLLPYPPPLLKVAYQQQIQVEVKTEQRVVHATERVLFYSPQVNMPPEPAGYIKVSKYDHY